ncbi:MAG TPA: ATP-binding protein [Ktedonobacterales bacterium]|nr:ATP-binding protein [Ktedonobacterales bacterium]
MDRMKDTIARLADQRAREVRRGRAASRSSAGRPDDPDPRPTVPRPPAANPPAPTAQPPQQPLAQQRQGARPAPTLPLARRPTPPPAIRAARGGERRAAGPQPLRPPIPADALDAGVDNETPVEDRILELPARPRTAGAAGAAKAAASPISPLRRPRAASASMGDSGMGRPEAAEAPRSSGAGEMASLGGAMQDYLAALARRRQSRAGDAAAPARARAAKPRRAPAEDVCPVCHGAGYYRMDVPVGDPSFGQPIPCACKEREIEERRRRNLDRFFSLKPFSTKTFETFDTAVPGVREAYEVARRFADNVAGLSSDEPRWLLLMGGYGTGKTHLAAAVAHRWLAAGQSVFFAVVPDLLDHLRAAFAPSSEMPYDEMFDTIREVELLVLDDLGAENGTAWATEKLFQLINYRYNEGLPTVITTNQQLHTRMDERIRSRLSDLSLVQSVIIKAQDRRPRNTGTARRR